ncbi:MAG: leucine--tRNA ligase [Nanoarchaeota archaeon]|nr:leucine--tRNA ligase [Nanoarchaeota archaeon]
MVDFNTIARKWQGEWEKAQIFEVVENSKKKKWYTLEMYPYPSSSSLHMGHARNYCIGDALARFKRMQGFNVLYPMGYDSFGLPAENAAIKSKSHPKIFIDEAIKGFIKQQKALGLSYDWSRMIRSDDPNYYKWDQWIFLKMYEKGLVYKKKSFVNWCPKCNTVLANEQVHDGKCWRHTDTEVEAKELSQWFLKITNYADELLDDIDKLKGWSEDVKTMQNNWIGKSEGVEIFFKLDGSDKVLPTYTTRCDTIFSVTYIVIAPEHPLAGELVKGTSQEEEFNKAVKIISKQSIIERTTPEGKDKIGCFLGKFAINPANNEKIPVYIANFVLGEYGTGIVMADAHDQRDFEFAKKYNIPLKFVISHDGSPINPDKAARAYLSDGVLYDSGEFSGMYNREALPLMADWLEKNKWGKKTFNYKLKDWLISRQRFWGCPIPMVKCEKCGIVPVPEADLPVKLPEDYKFTAGKGNPLDHCNDFVNTTCPKCNGGARRETDTMDTFVDSSWYFLRYCDPKNDELPFSPKKVDYWMPIDRYIGGREHATMHLIYFRFFTKFLRDIGLLKIDEPTLNLFNQGMLHKGGFVMSKSRGNVVTQEEIAKKYGIDTARLFLLFVASPDKDMEWSDEGIEGSFRFLNKFYNLITGKKIKKDIDEKEESKLNKTLKEVTEYVENLILNKAIISLMQFTNWFSNRDSISNISAEKLVLMMSAFTPHICEELWSKLGNKPFCSLAKWPDYDENKIDVKLEAAEEVVNQTVSDVNNVLKLIKIEKPKKITLIIAPKWKYSFIELFKREIEKTRDVKALMSVCMGGELKKYGKDISRLIPALLKDASKIPTEVLTQEMEFENLIESKEFISKEFNCEVIVEKAEESKEDKAKNASPSKPAILIE